jgi:hypothetical protein
MGWADGKIDSGATADLLAVERDGTEDAAADRVVELLSRGISPESIWDAVTCAAAEILMRNPGIVPLHAVTTTNAIRYIYERSQNDETRRLLLLQNASFLPFLRGGRGTQTRIDELVPIELPMSDDLAVSQICTAISRDKSRASRQVLEYLTRKSNPKTLLNAANRLIFLKGNDSHDYKFSAAALEDFNHLSSPWRERYLAASVYWMNGCEAKDNALVDRARLALAG